jgi:NADH-quinone oxidoreductase subunit K
LTVPSSHLLLLAAALFAIGIGGFLLRRNVIVVLMSIELMLNAANLTFIAGSRRHVLASADGALDPQGPVFAIFVIVVAAVEAAVGLALVIALYRHKQSVSLEDVHELEG